MQEKNLGNIGESAVSQQEEPSSSMKPMDGFVCKQMQTKLDSVVAIFTVLFKTICGINILVIPVLAEIPL